MRRIITALLALIFAGGLITACTQGKSGLAINDAWARPAKAGETSAIYFTINNAGGAADTLLSAACDAAMKAEIHMSMTDAAGTTSMKPQDKVPAPAGEKVLFKPGGLHIMLMNLKKDLEPGQKLSFTLHFEKAGDVQVEAEVRAP